MGCDKQKKEIKEIKKSICVKTDYFDLILFCLHLKRVTDVIENHIVISLQQDTMQLIATVNYYLLTTTLFSKGYS